MAIKCVCVWVGAGGGGTVITSYNVTNSLRKIVTGSICSMAKRKGKKVEEENVQLGPQVAEGELVFGVAHIFASFNDTFVHVTDLSGR